jgi:UDP-2-acetamido-2-deoxy-ribo-hexuluronate aminotransferase
MFLAIYKSILIYMKKMKTINQKPKISFVNLKKQYKSLAPEINSKIKKVLKHGQFIMGPEVIELEKQLSNYTGAKYCITVSSGTDALLISLMAIGIKRGDEVITTPFSFISTAEVIVLLGAKPVFVDIESHTCNIDASLIKKKITSKTKAIIAVSLFGQPSDMNEINQIAKFRGITVIEDAAQSFGSVYNNKKSCNLSNIGCTSFFPTKPLGCYGDGGAIFTNNKKLALIFREIREHGQKKKYVHSRIGIGGRMDTIQCAIILAKLKKFNSDIEKRTSLGEKYNIFFDKIGMKRVLQKKNRNSVFAQYSLMVDNRKKFIDFLKKKNVPTAIYYPLPINHQHAYKKYCCIECTPIANKIAKKIVSIPMSSELNFVEQRYIMNAIKSYVKKLR